MKTLILLAKGFETMEFSPFINIMGWAQNDYGYDTHIVTCGFQKQVISAFNIPIIVDTLIDDINVDDYDALAIPGGFEEFGFYEEAYSEKFLEVIKRFDMQKKPIATVCVGALPVGKSGVLQNRKATTYYLNGDHRQEQLKAFGVNLIISQLLLMKTSLLPIVPKQLHMLHSNF